MLILLLALLLPCTEYRDQTPDPDRIEMAFMVGWRAYYGSFRDEEGVIFAWQDKMDFAGAPAVYLTQHEAQANCPEGYAVYGLIVEPGDLEPSPYGPYWRTRRLVSITRAR